MGRTDPAVQLLQTIPGIGPFWALLLTTELLPLERFDRPAQMVSYAGLAPRTRSSGGKTQRLAPNFGSGFAVKRNNKSETRRRKNLAFRKGNAFEHDAAAHLVGADFRELNGGVPIPLAIFTWT